MSAGRVAQDACRLLYLPRAACEALGLSYMGQAQPAIVSPKDLIGMAGSDGISCDDVQFSLLVDHARANTNLTLLPELNDLPDGQTYHRPGWFRVQSV